LTLPELELEFLGCSARSLITTPAHWG